MNCSRPAAGPRKICATSATCHTALSTNIRAGKGIYLANVKKIADVLKVPAPSLVVGYTPPAGTPRKVLRVKIKGTLNAEELQERLALIEKVAGCQYEIEVEYEMTGSTMVGLNVDARDAEAILSAFEEGKLAELGVIDVTVSEASADGETGDEKVKLTDLAIGYIDCWEFNLGPPPSLIKKGRKEKENQVLVQVLFLEGQSPIANLTGAAAWVNEIVTTAGLSEHVVLLLKPEDRNYIVFSLYEWDYQNLQRAYSLGSLAPLGVTGLRLISSDGDQRSTRPIR